MLDTLLDIVFSDFISVNWIQINVFIISCTRRPKMFNIFYILFMFVVSTFDYLTTGSGSKNVVSVRN